ncbi:hypothetical protein N0V90_007633 [Kalmusia sp. IMI 367209]|nr:hypothetical protein N0V90_007633 [Kalmusia sp. IMI 367209]
MLRLLFPSPNLVKPKIPAFMERHAGAHSKINFQPPIVFSGDCLKDCSNVTNIYQSIAQVDPYDGNGQGPIRRYLTCANVPNMAGYLSQKVIGDNITSIIANNISTEATDDQLKKVTFAVTECLTSTCRNARHKAECRDKCSPVNLLINNTTPDVQGLNNCLNSLCTGGYDALPYADADVVGIGVFTSYIMQCMLVVILWFGLSGFQVYKLRRQKNQNLQKERMTEKSEATAVKKRTPSMLTELTTHEEIFEKCIVEFHKAQCYFSATIQIASLSYGIFETDMLITFMLTPLATNGVLPVVFTYLLLFRCGKATFDATLLTAGCWLLASLVYWILYSSIIPINQDITSDVQRYRAYQQFMYKLSALEACGGYSALAVCPNNFNLGKKEIFDASHNLRILTPIIWSFATVCLLVTLAGKMTKWMRRRDSNRFKKSDADNGEMEQVILAIDRHFLAYDEPE